MSAAAWPVVGGAVALASSLVAWWRAVWTRNAAARDAALAKKADIDARHVERRDLSKDPRPR